MSHTACFWPIISAVVKAEDILGRNRQWNPASDEQEHFFRKFFSARKQLENFSDKEMRSWARWVAWELNQILKEEEFGIELQDFGPGEFGTVSILDVMVEWLLKGEKVTVRGDDGKEYPAVSIDATGEVDGKGEILFTVHSSNYHDEAVVSLKTRSGDIVNMTIADKERSGFDLVDRIERIKEVFLPIGYFCESVIFPMVDLDQEEDISWLKGARTFDRDGKPWIISQALQQTKFKMNEIGARVKSAVALGFRAVSMPRVLTIDKPFFLWVERPGLIFPILYAYVDEKNWKNPGSLEM